MLTIVEVFGEAMFLVSIFFAISLFASFLYLKIRYPDRYCVFGFNIDRWLFGSGVLYHALLFSYTIFYMQ